MRVVIGFAWNAWDIFVAMCRTFAVRVVLVVFCHDCHAYGDCPAIYIILHFKTTNHFPPVMSSGGSSTGILSIWVKVRVI